MAFEIIITDAGRAAIVNATNTGTAPVTIASVGLTATAFAADATLTQLPDQLKTVAAVGGQVVADDTIHVTMSDESSDTYTLQGFGLYLSDGTLFAVYSQADPILEKAAAALALLAVDIKFTDIAAADIAFGATDWLNPPATHTTPGVVALATAAEAVAGADDTKAVTPAGLEAVAQAIQALITWANLPGKPATFPPSPHTHDAADIVSGILALARLPIGTSGAAIPRLDQAVTFSAAVSLSGGAYFNGASGAGLLNIGNTGNGSTWQIYPVTSGTGSELRFWTTGTADVLRLRPDGTASLPLYDAGLLQVGAGGVLTTTPGPAVLAGASDSNVLTLRNSSNGTNWVVFPITNGAGSDLAMETGGLIGLRLRPDGTVLLPQYGAGFLQVGAGGVLSSTPTATVAASPGYITLPGGIIVQWGSTGNPLNPHTDVTLPLTFPTAVLAVFGTSTNVGGAAAIAATVLSTSSIRLTGNPTNTTGANWIAIGH